MNESTGYVTASHFIDGVVRFTFRLMKGRPNELPTFPFQKAYKTRIPLNSKKVQDVAKIIRYIPLDYQWFYHNIIHWPQETVDHSDAESV